MCTLHKAPSAQNHPKPPRAEESSHPYLMALLAFSLAMALKISLLLAFCYLHASIKEAPHEHCQYSEIHPGGYQKRTLC